jgi:hypothetical protein
MWWPDGSLLRRWSRSTVELLLLWLELSLLVLLVLAPILLLLRSAQWTPGGVYTMWYLGGAPLEPPLAEDPGIILFLFFSSASLDQWQHSLIHYRTGWGKDLSALVGGR